MPTYQYACTDCGHRFEEVQSFTDASLIECPVCTGKLRKVYGSIGVVFKGSGFYRNDSRSNGKDGKTGESEGSSTDSAAAEKKPAAATSADQSSSSSSSPGGKESSSTPAPAKPASGSSPSVTPAKASATTAS